MNHEDTVRAGEYVLGVLDAEERAAVERDAAGDAELAAEIARRDEAFSDVVVDVTPLDVGGDHACVEWQATMTHSGPIEVADGASIDATGLRVTVHGVTVAEFHRGRICSVRQYWNELALLEQLGLVPEPEPVVVTEAARSDS